MFVVAVMLRTAVFVKIKIKNAARTELRSGGTVHWDNFFWFGNQEGSEE